jgi:hypothetical protein
MDASEPGSDEIGGGKRLSGADLRQVAVIEETERELRLIASDAPTRVQRARAPLSRFRFVTPNPAILPDRVARKALRRERR